MKILILVGFVIVSSNALAWDMDFFGMNKRKQEIAEQDARVKEEVGKWDNICEICKSKMSGSLPNGIRVLDWNGMCAPRKTSTGHLTSISAIITGSKLVHATCYTDQSYRIIDFSLSK